MERHLHGKFCGLLRSVLHMRTSEESFYQQQEPTAELACHLLDPYGIDTLLPLLDGSLLDLGLGRSLGRTNGSY